MSSITAAGRWTAAERVRLSAIVAVVVLMHVVGWSLYFYYSHSLTAATTFAGAGTLAYALGVRHAFDADHIAAIDDTTRLMLQRGRRPIGVGFFFAMGHSSVVLVLAFVVAIAAGAATDARVDAFRDYGALAAAVVAASFLMLVAVLNSMVLVGVLRLWRAMARGEVSEREIEIRLVNQGLLNRMLGGRTNGLIRSSWHMFPVGLLFGLGLETASEVTLLTLSASAATEGALPALAVLTLPLLFAAGMSALDTFDSLLMTRAYSWSYRKPARRLYYNVATTAMTVLVALFVSTVYLAGLVSDHMGTTPLLASYAALGEHFELLGYGIVAMFALAWVLAAIVWRIGRFEERYGG